MESKAQVKEQKMGEGGTAEEIHQTNGGLQNLLREQKNDLQQQKYALESRADQTPGEENEGQ